MAAHGRITERGALVALVIRNEPHWQKNEEREADQSGLPMPNDERGFAAIDTGASMTMVQPAVLDRLGAMPDKVVRLQGLEPTRKWALGAPFETQSSFVEIEFLGVSLRMCVSVAAVPFGDAFGEGVLAVIGRDLLDQLMVTWDGPARTVILDAAPLDD